MVFTLCLPRDDSARQWVRTGLNSRDVVLGWVGSSLCAHLELPRNSTYSDFLLPPYSLHLASILLSPGLLSGMFVPELAVGGAWEECG